ncbi:unnamed protein product [Acanthoscelides obtectus]|uniref:Uncharacterized protein n=1 Tax=Acanthoscelides obtectus TaxID=200917 RepID=A0A9P0KAF0_ACAOB|nr:unnamed protein product [Acanthoscelides obtectus]CAK1633553.1 RNA-directed DNA polymerase from mobile element jockey [Acanthoscelides obtectus]
MNNAITTGSFPAIWKRAELILLQKRHKRLTVAADFRPISLLDAAGKLQECMILERLLEVNETISARKYGFRRVFACII